MRCRKGLSYTFQRLATVTIPNRSVFRAQEVCDLAEIQLYMLRSWEAEFPDLGIAKSSNAPRVYRRADVERVLRIKHLLFVDGLTLAGARRKLSEEQPPADAADDLTALLGSDAREVDGFALQQPVAVAKVAPRSKKKR